MKRKTFIKKMRGLMEKCHAINKAAGTVTYHPGRSNFDGRWQLPESMSYQGAYDGMAAVLLPIVERAKEASA